LAGVEGNFEKVERQLGSAKLGMVVALPARRFVKLNVRPNEIFRAIRGVDRARWLDNEIAIVAEVVLDLFLELARGNEGYATVLPDIAYQLNQLLLAFLLNPTDPGSEGLVEFVRNDYAGLASARVILALLDKLANLRDLDGFNARYRKAHIRHNGRSPIAQ